MRALWVIVELVGRAAEVIPWQLWLGGQGRGASPVDLSSAQDAATEHHRLGSLDSAQVYVTILETGKSKVKLQVH